MEHHSGNYGPLGSGMNANANAGSLGANTAPNAENMMPNLSASNVSPVGGGNMPYYGNAGAYAGRIRGMDILVLFILLVIICRVCVNYVRKC